MELKTALYGIVAVSVLIFLILLIVYQWMSRRSARDGPGRASRDDRELLPPQRRRSARLMHRLLHQSYADSMKIPLLRRYVSEIRRRMAGIYSYDETTVRSETMKIVWMTFAIAFIAALLLVIWHRDILSVIVVLLVVLMLHNTIVDTFVSRVENRLLRQLSHMISDVRHHYHAHGMVEEAIYEASETASYEAAEHGKKVYEMLTSNNPEESLDRYYEVAPNRFLKGFAGISHFIREFGDKMRPNGSMYLHALTKLNAEIKLEAMRRDKLNYLLKSLTLVAVAPVLFTKPIESWARNNFPAMGQFYDSKFGFIVACSVYFVILASYLLLRKIQETDEGKYAAKTRKGAWEKKWYGIAIVRLLVERVAPPPRHRLYYKTSALLKDANIPLPVEWFYLRRILLCVLFVMGSLSASVYLHALGTNNVLYGPTRSAAMFGTADETEMRKAYERTEFDRQLILRLGKEGAYGREQIAAALRNMPQLFRNQTEMGEAAKRIATKIEMLNAEYLKWWEVMIAVSFGCAAYYAPVWVAMFQKRMRSMEMKNEVDQFHTVIAMLCEFDRISVENILEWMERFASIFKEPLQNCLLHYEAGADRALEELKMHAPFVPFVRTVEKLQLAADKIPVKQAFDDLESEQAFYYEERKQEYERMIDAKAAWGKMIGFTPLYTLVFMYLVIPLVYMSMNQMNVYYEQIQKIN
ncbi:hypothetical protein [Paenibacillus sp. MSJ-34]|uniref:hypothetical protein n=1 Tax=Paenibacillus sp. MSJ-34 TaxID=2841529 RepID=UPI001C127461|nr:hypothetical protein [Paenibacillus sp. MSJ-34]MBU5443160.1 hypothetical protein [Paenibacillus sp. MSJ-34]